MDWNGAKRNYSNCLKDSGDLDSLRDNSQFRNMLSDISEYLEEQDFPQIWSSSNKVKKLEASIF
ncbi:MAG: hypothetical protein Ct9H300mP2_1120 [Candidatus Neomarinimicrobiota bacterium]|nr:MAG: hypothetical protein Ct9H300mP2_1120 [Candidatus Neomarinimicrobiota bacterium]